jgi:hypothetical protein
MSRMEWGEHNVATFTAVCYIISTLLRIIFIIQLTNFVYLFLYFACVFCFFFFTCARFVIGPSAVKFVHN